MEENLRLFNKALEGRLDNYRIDKRFLRKDGSILYISLSVVCVRNEDKSVHHFLSTYVDITENKIHEENISKEKIFLRTLIDNLPSLVYILDNKGRKLISNRADFENSGHKIESEVLGKTDIELYPGDLGIRGHTDNMSVIETGKPIFDREEMFFDKFGNAKWLLTTKLPLFGSGKKSIGLIGIGHDITDRKLMINKITESEAYYRTLIDLSPDGIVTCDMNGKLTFASKRAFEIFGEDPDANVIGISVFNWLDPKHHQVINEHLNNVLSGDLKPATGEYKLLRKDRTTFWAELSSSPLVNSKGKATGLLIVCHDISERKKAEEEIIRARDRAEESDRLKTAFLHNISHEIRTPMNAITGFSALLGEPDLDSESRRSFIDVITRSSDHLLSIVNDIIEISNIEAGIIKINRNNINVNSILKGLYDQFAIIANERNIAFKYTAPLPDNDAIILTDRTKLEEILSNLLSNAFKFTQKGQIGFGYKLKDKSLEFYVSDTGIGIPEDMHLRIFDRFFQVENAVSRQYEGTGLGLSISKAYAELLGGRIWLTSEQGKGTIFCFTLPYNKIHLVSTSEKEIIVPEKVKINSKKTILIAEDDEFSYLLIVKLLSSLRINLIRAKNGKEAVELCKSPGGIDLVLMDVKMPLMDGYTATIEIRKMLPSLPVVAITAYAYKSDKEKILDSGCNDYISKPVKKEVLLKVLYKYIKS